LPERQNREDRYAVAVMDGTSIVGHLQRKISNICCIFLLHSESIICCVTGPKQYSRDLEQGTLDVPCEYRFYSKDKCVKVTRKLLELASFPTKDIEVKGSATAPSTSSKDTSNDTTENYIGIVVSSTCSATSHSTTSSNTGSTTSHSTTTSTAIICLTAGSTVSSTINCSTAHSVTALAIS